MEQKTDVQAIKVVYGIDRNYLVPAAVSMRSLCAHTTAPLEIIVYGDGLEPSDDQTLLKVGAASGATVDVRRYNPSSVEDFKRNFHAQWPAILALRLELPWLVEGRCLFIDADTLVVGDVSEIMAIDMQGMPLGACIDPGIDSQGNLATARRRLVRTTVLDLLLPKRSRRRRQAQLSRAISMGLRPGDVYFNSGVLVMECDTIRPLAPLNSRGLPLDDPGGMEPYAEHLPDQDRLNEFFAGRYRKLPLRWNLKPVTRTAHWPESARLELEEALSEPGIWHFMGARKPWKRSTKSRMMRHHPAFQAWQNTYGKVRDLCDLGDAYGA